MPLYRCRETGERACTICAYFLVEYRRAAREGVAEELPGRRGIFKVIKRERNKFKVKRTYPCRKQKFKMCF